MRVLIVGCGYVGRALAVELVRRGHQVWGLCRTSGASSSLSSVGVHPLVADVSLPESFSQVGRRYDWVVYCAATKGGTPEEYRRTYFRGMENLIEWLSPSPPNKLIYTGSTSVYGQTDGSAVDETSPTVPCSDTSRILLETEKLLLSCDFPAVVLRLAGIYGPGRAYWLDFVRAQRPRNPALDQRLINMVHRDDVVGGILAALAEDYSGNIYNVVDDQPVTQLALLEWLSSKVGCALPPSANDAPSSNRRSSSNKKVGNLRIKAELRYQFRFPTFREGYASILNW